jgi:hypothetical protein
VEKPFNPFVTTTSPSLASAFHDTARVIAKASRRPPRGPATSSGSEARGERAEIRSAKKKPARRKTAGTRERRVRDGAEDEATKRSSLGRSTRVARSHEDAVAMIDESASGARESARAVGREEGLRIRRRDFSRTRGRLVFGPQVGDQAYSSRVRVHFVELTTFRS